MAIIKYIIAEDHKIFRAGLRLTLSDDHKLKCIGEAGNGAELLELLKTQNPDVIIMDLEMPVMGGIEATREIHKLYPNIKILILTIHNDEQFIIHLLETGACGYLTKNTEARELINAMHSAYETGYYFNDMVSNAMLKRVILKNQIRPSFNKDIQLTDRETEVLKLICQEFTTAEIAGQVNLSQRTVEGIRAAMLEKIGVRNTAGLVMYAIRNKIVN